MRLCVAGVLVLLQLLAVRGLYINEAVSKMYHAHLKSTEAELYKHTPVVCARGDQCDYAIVLIEPRTLPDAVALAKYVVYNVMYFIQLKTQFTWSVQIFCTQSNLEQMRDIFADVPNIVFTTQEEVPFEGTHFDPSNPTAPAIWMNYFFMSPLVWDAMVPVVRDHILFLHTDCLLLRPGIDEYMQYDYLGAPWDMGGNPKTTRSSDGGVVGNGGFSIRSISTMKRCVAPGGVGARSKESTHVPEAGCTFHVRARARGSEFVVLYSNLVHTCDPLVNRSNVRRNPSLLVSAVANAARSVRRFPANPPMQRRLAAVLRRGVTVASTKFRGDHAR